MITNKLRHLCHDRKSHRDRLRSLHNRLRGMEGMECRILLSTTAMLTGGDPVDPPEMAYVDTVGRGESSARIVNGQPTNAYPSVGIIGDRSGGFCSGTLITPMHALTAAHCASGVGNSQGRFTVGGQTYSTIQVTVHPQYNDNTLSNDIAIFTLGSTVTNIAPSPINRTTPFVGQMLTLVGFGGGGTGSSGHTGDFGTKRVGTTPIDGVTSTLITWRFDNNSESNTAPGDSGGPAFIQLGGTYYVAGVTSGGDRQDAGIGDNSFDTRVDAFAAWVDAVTGQVTTPNPSGDDHADLPGPDATLIQVDNTGYGTITGTLEEAGDRDVFQFVVTGSGSATMAATGLNGLDTYLRIYDSSGRLVTENDDFGGTLNSQVQFEVSPGIYFGSLGAYADRGIGDYRLDVAVTTVTPNPSGDDHADSPGPDATLIQVDDTGHGTKTGTLEKAGDRDVFQVVVTAPGSATISATGLNGLDTYLRVYDGSGRFVAENDDHGGTLNSQLQLDVSPGTYFASLGSYADRGTGEYRLDVAVTPFSTPTPPPGADEIVLDDSGRGQAFGEISLGEETDFYTFTANVTGRITIRTRALSRTLDTTLTIYDSLGNEVAFNDDYRGTDSRVRINALAGATYLAEVGSWGGTTGRYRLNIETRASTEVRAVKVPYSSWTNPNDPLDVNNDGRRSPLDILNVINFLNVRGGGELETLPRNSAARLFYDVNGDRRLSPIDALMLINHFNSADSGNTSAEVAGPTDIREERETDSTVRRPFCNESLDGMPIATVVREIPRPALVGSHPMTGGEYDHSPWYGDNDPFGEEEDWLF